MATNGSLDSTKISGRYLTFSWEVVSTSVGTTTIDWKLTSTGGGQVNSTFTVTLNGEKIVTRSNQVVSFKNATVATGSKTYNHDASGAAKVEVEISVLKFYTEIDKPNVKSGSWDLEVNMPYSSCYWKNPTISINKSIEKPDGSITITWTGAQSGTGNLIDGFIVSVKGTSGGQPKTLSVNADKSASSAIIGLKNANFDRGSSIQASVFIKQTWEGATEAVQSGGQCRINRLPSAPTISNYNSKIIIPSTQNTYSFVVYTGFDNDDQSYSVHYSVGDEPNRRAYSSGSDIQLNNTTVVHFWTYDGLEYSAESKDCEIIRNTKPTLEAAISGDDFDKTLIVTNIAGGQLDNNKFTYGYTYDKKDYILLQESTAQSYNYGDIRSFLSTWLVGLNQNTEYKYQCWVKRHDGIEESEKANVSEFSFVVPVLTIDDSDDYFSKTYPDRTSVAGYYNPYPGARNVESYSIKGQKLTYLQYSRDANSAQWFRINLTEGQIKTRIQDFELKISNLSNIFKPYSSAELFFSIDGAEEQYGFSSLSAEFPSVNIGGKEVAVLSGSKPEIWNYALTPAHLWGEGGLASSVANDSTASKQTTLTIQNKYGDSFSSTVVLNFDFKEPPSIVDFDVNGQISNNNYSLSSFNYVKEKVVIEPAGTVEYYGSRLEGNIIDTETGTAAWRFVATNGGYWITPWQEENGGWVRKPRVYNLSFLSTKEIEQILTDYVSTYKLTVTCGGTTRSASTEEIMFKRHTPPRVQFVELKYTNNKLTGKYRFTDLGYDNVNTNGSIVKVYLDANGNNAVIEDKGIEKANTSTIYSFEINNFDFGTATFRSIGILCDSLMSVQYGQDFTGETDYSTIQPEAFVVYNILPTIAYRENQVGINTNNPALNGEDKLPKSILTVSAFNENQETGRQYIYLVASNNNLASIDLTNGGMNGFVVDAGTWDNIPGGIIPGHGDTPANLAMVAYTGEISDLEQEATIEIHLIAGGAPI